jgi:hypothetical protein
MDTANLKGKAVHFVMAGYESKCPKILTLSSLDMEGLLRHRKSNVPLLREVDLQTYTDLES